MIRSNTFIVPRKDKNYGKSTECLYLSIKKLDSRPIWLPLADTLLTKTPGHGSSNMIRMMSVSRLYNRMGKLSTGDFKKIQAGFKKLIK